MNRFKKHVDLKFVYLIEYFTLKKNGSARTTSKNKKVFKSNQTNEYISAWESYNMKIPRRGKKNKNEKNSDRIKRLR